MATTPVAATSPAPGFQPAFKRVPQSDRHDDTLAVIATITGQTLDEIRKQAEVLGLPKVGPYYPWIDGDLIARLLAHFGWVATVWKECSEFKELPDLAICMVSYDADWEAGRNIVMHRTKAGNDGRIIHYAIDPYPHEDPKLHVRTDLTGLVPSWFIGVHQMKPSGK